MIAPRAALDVAALWRRVAAAPGRASGWFFLAVLHARLGFVWQAAYASRQAVRLNPRIASRLSRCTTPREGSTDEADTTLGHPTLAPASPWAAAFEAQVRACPGDWLTWLYLARLSEMAPAARGVPPSPQGRFLRKAQGDSAALWPKGTQELEERRQHSDAAPGGGGRQALGYAVALEPLPGESLHWLGVWRLRAGDAASAVDALSVLLDIRPMRCGSMMFLAEALLQCGKVLAAEKAFARASLSDQPTFLLTLAARAFAHNYWQEAIAVLRKALRIEPTSVVLWLALARIQSEVCLLDDCRASLRRLLELDPCHAEAKLLQSCLCGQMGDARHHLSHLQAAYEASGSRCFRMASAVAMASICQDQMPHREVAALHRRLCAPLEAEVPARRWPVPGEVPARRLRLGFVTGDLHRQHPVNLFLLPVLRRLDHRRLHVSIYYTGRTHDEYTLHARAAADHWREVEALDDAQLGQTIADDGIDILVDLSGHTSGQRLAVFAGRAAPVQATFLGYPHSTGLSAMDWLIGDATVAPAAHADLFSERIAQLPDCVFCWAPVDTYALPPARPPGTPLVFASFNNAMKLTPRTLRLWAEVLRAVPNSCLLLKAPSLRDDGVRAALSAALASHGVDPQRLSFRGPSGLEKMMQEYGDVDIALDPTPYNGGTTSVQALWMGVPVITLEGGSFVSRMGASIMRTLGQPGWVAADEAGYVQSAVSLASKVAGLRAGRPALRQQMADSPLCDIHRYVESLQALLEHMWQDFCETRAQPVITLAGTHRDVGREVRS